MSEIGASSNSEISNSSSSGESSHHSAEGTQLGQSPTSEIANSPNNTENSTHGLGEVQVTPTPERTPIESISTQKECTVEPIDDPEDDSTTVPETPVELEPVSTPTPMECTATSIDNPENSPEADDEKNLEAEQIYSEGNNPPEDDSTTVPETPVELKSVVSTPTPMERTAEPIDNPENSQEANNEKKSESERTYSEGNNHGSRPSLGLQKPSDTKLTNDGTTQTEHDRGGQEKGVPDLGMR